MGVKSIGRVFLMLLMAVVTVWAQQDRGTFTGSVTDPTGAVVPAVKVTVVNTETNATYESQTNEVGNYRVPNLPVGNYKITFESQGFKSVVRDGLTLNVAQVARVDAQMQIGNAAESIEVTAEVPLLQTETPDVGTVLNNRTVTDLPLGFAGGRAAENFAYKLTPGVGGNNWESRINGSASFSKAIVLDGADATIYIGGQLGESSPSMEALEEFKVQTSGMSAEFGRTGGGVFNFVMKSGTNQFHGSALGQIHNEWMDANTFTNNFYDRDKKRDRRHNYAFSAGGPIIIPKLYNGRDKTFVYGTYERYKESYAGGGSPTVTLPLAEWWDGNLSRYLTTEKLGTDALGRDIFRGMIFDPATTRTVNGQVVRDPFQGNIIPANRISKVSKNLAGIFKQHYMPEVKGPDGLVPLQNNAFFPVSNQAGFTQDQYSAKVDHYFSAAHKINGSIVYVDRPRNLLDQGGVWDFNDPDGGPLSRARLQHVRSWYGRAAYDWTVSPTVLNHLQLGFNRQRNPSLSKHLDENGASILGLQGFTRDYNFPEIDFARDASDRVKLPTVGYQANDFLAGQNIEIGNTLSWMKGRHALKFGANYRLTWMRARNDAGPGRIDFSGGLTGQPGFNLTGHSFASMLLGEVSGASVPMNTPVGSKWENWALFVQDDFKVTPTFTLNLGLRWDYQPLMVEQYNRIPQINPNLIDPLYNRPGAMEYASADRRNFGESQWNDFGPRIGLAWQVQERTSIRAAYGIYYHGRNPNGWSGVPWGSLIGYQQVNRMQGKGIAAAFNWDTPYLGTIESQPQTPSLASFPANNWGPVSWDPDAGKVGYQQQWNFNIQRELPWQMVFDIGYVGSKGTGIQANEMRRINQLDPKYLSLGSALTTWVNNDAALPASIKAAGGRYLFGNSEEWIPAWSTLTPYPQLIYWNDIYSAFSPLGFNTYHALQVQLNKRYSSGVQWLANYTWSKSIDNVNSAFGDTWGQNWGRPMDYYNLSLDKSVSAFDRTHVIKVGGSFDMPYGRGRKWGTDINRAVDFALGGWTLQFIGNYSSGEPMGFGGTGSVGNFATQRAMLAGNGGEFKLDWDKSKLDMSRISVANPNHKYFDTSLVRNTTQFERGNTAFRYGQLRRPWLMTDDFSLQKNFQPLESMRIQFRAEFLNLFNRTLLDDIETDASSPLFGQVVGFADWYDPRKIQFGIRADW